MLHSLLDENISPVVADGLAKRWPRMLPATVHTWKSGSLLGAGDAILLQAALTENLTLVTFDVNTIPAMITAWAEEGTAHAGIVFVNTRTISQDAHGTPIRALGQFWMQHRQINWLNRIAFLPRPKAT
jgi:hypothetical protein